VRHEADGSLDDSFSGDGMVVLDGLGYLASDSGAGVTVQADGKIVVAGTSGSDIGLIRLNVDGSLDTSFERLAPGASEPAASTQGGTAHYVEGNAPIVLDEQVAVHDADLAALDGGQGDYAGARLTLSRQNGPSSQDVFSGVGPLAFGHGSAVLSGVDVGSVVNGKGTLAITFNANATQDRVPRTPPRSSWATSTTRPPAVSRWPARLCGARR
jgi:hypothetical protein